MVLGPCDGRERRGCSNAAPRRTRVEPSTGPGRCVVVHSSRPASSAAASELPSVGRVSDPSYSRLQRYLRVAYDGARSPVGGGDEQTAGAAVREPGRWAVRTSAAVRIAAVLLVLAVAGATYLLLSRSFAPRPSDAPAAPVAEPLAPSVQPVQPAASDGTSAAAEAGSAATIVVHVAGAVTDPGVVEVTEGTRVVEVITAAGGSADDADLDALNLAAPVTDGQQVYVPREGEVGPGGVASPGASGDAGAHGPGLVNINTADATALDTLPGIGPALADRIITWRTEHGPFTSVDALTDVSGIGPATMERLRDLVTV